MSESKSESARCASCLEESATSFSLPEQDGPTTRWHFCACGSIYHPNPLDPAYFLNGYREQRLRDLRDIADRHEHLRRCYVPFIEEVVWGRRFLDVGFMIPTHIEGMRERGWISKGIDLIPTDGQITGDFEEYDFKLAKQERYDLIWMGHVLECFREPVSALQKAYDLLKPSGALFITTPDAEMLWNSGIREFGHFQSRENRFFFSERELTRQLTRIGFDVNFRLKSFSRRFVTWHSLHALARKPHHAD